MSDRTRTPATTEGPYYKAGSPERSDLREEGVVGDDLVLTGHVLDESGQPVPGAWLDFWQADGDGKYDNAGYALRGHQFAGQSGEYALRTVVPCGYTGRTPHIHVKVRAGRKGPILTTQLFFPEPASNSTDAIFRDDLLINFSGAPGGRSGTFDFVLPAP